MEHGRNGTQLKWSMAEIENSGNRIRQKSKR